MPKQTVALFFGGKSAEHEISIISARSIAAQIDRNRYELSPLYIDRDGKWHGLACSQTVLDTDIAALLRSGSPEAAGQRIDELTAAAAGERFDFGDFLEKTDVAFIALHGSHGEDGKIQGCLDTFGIPYTGCGLTASALAMDKALTKLCAVDAGVAVAESMTVLSRDYAKRPLETVVEVTRRFAWPLFVKPASLGSSVGISKVRSVEELSVALETACELDGKVLVEASISGREIEVAVLGNGDALVSAPGEIIPGSDFYSYEDKYIKNEAKLVIPADLPEGVANEVRNAALTIFKALGCAGMSRVDFFVENGTNRVILNEINTIPGFTDISMYPMMMAASGISFPELIEKLLLLALEKRPITPKI
ncbi:D-alanine--D-alanine ligase [Chlorobaculum sp. 24CR]|uniref:D-alanine--D-alanine ligase family protein n=1 Tax=Chlorobaculum sp. 24CR TaxID=2508878 RepID=UPI00100A4739|nr:D-alanine--D-alanine ligase family protein [Chlorobaculum sp. 24CR]RXK84654.1 D-alanine--D-alanine ligase [Chlorobaculum sp. 24CR]